MLLNETTLQSHTNNPRAPEIAKLRELMLQPTKIKEITTPFPMMRDTTPLLRVSNTTTEDPPEIEQETEYEDYNFNNMSFEE